MGDGVEGADEAGDEGGEGCDAGTVLTRPRTGAAGIGRCGRSEDGKGR
jgi:hypothetical protein